jgi:flagellar L-ring protein precursor FlgH
MYAVGQNNSLFREPLANQPGGARSAQPELLPPPRGLEHYSWTYIPPPGPRKFEVEDIVFIRVNEIARMSSEGQLQRRRNSLYDFILNDWVVLNGLRSIKPSPQSDGDPRVRSTHNRLDRAQVQLDTSEQLSLNIAARIADIRPNGTLVLEAHKIVRINNEVWEVSLSGICRPQDIADNNMILSDRIYDLRIAKRELGHVRDSYKRGWFTRWFDQFSPF